MKSIILSTIVTLCSLCSFQVVAQWNTVATNHIYSTNSGNVGINTGSGTTPPSRLSVYGSSTVPVTDIGITSFSTASNAQSTLWFRHDPSGRDAQIIYQADGRLSFNLDNNASNVSANEYLTISQTGKVGIGHVSPAKALEVKTGSNNFIAVGSNISGGEYSGIQFGYMTDGSTSYRKSALVFERVDNAARGKIHFLNNNGNDATSAVLADARMTINSDGNIGISNTAPVAKLEITNSINSNTNEVAAGQDHLLMSSTINPGNGGYFGGVTWENGGRRRASISAAQESSDQDFVGLAFFTKGTDGPGSIAESMRISREGNVGIGTTAPSQALEINGTGTELSALIWNKTTNGSKMYLTSMAGKTSIQSGGDFIIRTNPGGIWTDRLVVTTAGNVGIGKANPTDKLEVNGVIHTQEVRVDMTGWSDYVFEDNYHLMSLSELSKYIKANKHLPEVPSAREVLANGIKVGEMNAILLKKIEELTLHLIDMKEQLDKQQKEIEQLKSN